MEVSLYWSETSKLWRRKTGWGGLSLVGAGGAGGTQVEAILWRRRSLWRHIGGAGPPLKPRVSTEESVGREGGRQGAAEDGLKSSGLVGAEVVEVDELLVCGGRWRGAGRTERLSWLSWEADRATSGPRLALLELTSEESERLLLGRNPGLGLA